MNQITIRLKGIFSLNSILIVILCSSCKKESISDDSFQSPFKVKYEITTSSPLSTTAGTGLSVYYTNENGSISNSLYNNSVPWVKEETITESSRPLQIVLYTDGIILNNEGYITGNIYINGVKKASFRVVTKQNSSIGGYNIATLNAQYVVK